MSVDNTNVQMKKGILEYCVLHIISRGEVYTSDLITELTNAKMVVVEGTLYPLLTRLKNTGWLEYKWVESAYGPPRKYYSLTETGAEMLSLLDQTWQEISDAVTLIVNKNGTHSSQSDQQVTEEVDQREAIDQQPDQEPNQQES